MRLVFLAILLFLNSIAIAQVNWEGKMAAYGEKNGHGTLFLHFDKNVYSNNETIYFTGYILKSHKSIFLAHEILALTLVRNVDSAIVLSDKFKIQGGISFGSLTLPDSILTGDYQLVAYTDRLINKKPELLFIQPITIKSNSQPPYNASLKLYNNSTQNNKHSTLVILSTSTKEGRFLSKPALLSYRYGNLANTGKTDAQGQWLVNLPDVKNTTDPNLYVKLKFEKDSTFVNIEIPQSEKRALVSFYPEGGQLVNGLQSTVGWEVKSPQNQSISVQGLLYKGDHIIDTIQTSTFGIGSFSFTPEKGVHYSVRLVHSELVDSVYSLPKAIDEGITMTVNSALTTDTLRFITRSKEQRNLKLLIHNFNQSYLNTDLEIIKGRTSVRVDLSTVPKGLNTLTVMDSLGRPLAERIFFAHYDPSEQLQITSDKASYNKREKVNIELELNNLDTGLVSIAVVQDSRLSHKKMNDIISYSYLYHQLGSLPLFSLNDPFRNQDYLENVLLVKGWTKYKWADLLADDKILNTYTLDSLRIKGKVVKTGKTPPNPFEIATMGNTKIELLKTSPSGDFEIPASALLTFFNNNMYVFLNGKDQTNSKAKIMIDDAFQHQNTSLVKQLPTDWKILPSSLVNNKELLLKSSEKPNLLKEVIIEDKSKTFHYGANACGDYVCPFNILNCVNHMATEGNTAPVKGRTYLASSGNRATVVYGGCNTIDNSIFTKVNGVHLPKEFYISDNQDPNEPAFFSTLYWSYQTFLEKGKPKNISFYTGDIAGKFRIIVQGIGKNEVIFADRAFEVVDNKKARE